MPHDSNSSAPASGPTSTSAARAPHGSTKAGTSKPSKPSGPASESEFLTRQAADAKAAIARAKSDIAQDLARTADPRAWLAVAPWTTLAGAAVAGFLAAAVAIPSKQEQALRRLRKLEKALEAEEDRREEYHHRRRQDEGKSEAAAKGSTLGAMIGALAGAVQPVLMNIVSSALSGKAAQPPEAGNGAAGPEAGAAAPPGQNGGEASQI